MTTPPQPDLPSPDRDSLLVAGVIELLGGGVPSEHPLCPGAVFRLAPDYNTGAPQPSADVVARLLQGGSRPHGRWAGNRTVTLPVVILGPDRATIVAGRELLAMLTDAQRYEVAWLREGAVGPMILDAYRAGPAIPAYSIIEEKQDFCRVQIAFEAAPYGRSDLREALWFPGGAVGGPPAPDYRPWMLIDDYTTVHSEVQPGSWGRANRPGVAPWPWSAHWNPLAGADTPVYHRILPAPADMTGRQHMNLWVGLGNSNGQWRGGNLTFRFTLYDTAETVMTFGGTYWLSSSDNWDKPTFDRISVPMPQGVSFGPLAEYIIECPSFTAAARMGDIYLHLLGAAPAAEVWQSAHGGRDGIYMLRSAGTARAPVSLRAQTPAGIYAVTQLFEIAGDYADWVPPADLVAAPDGTPDAVQARVFGAGGASGTLTTTAPVVMSGGGAGGGVAGDDHYPVTPGVPVGPVRVGQGGQPSAVQGQPPPGGYSQFGDLIATGGDTPTTDRAVNASPGRGQDPAPIRHSGGWSAVPVGAGPANQGAGGGGGGAGSSGDGQHGGNPPTQGQPGGPGGPGGGGQGAGGESPFVDGTPRDGHQPGGGGGGVTRRTSNLPTIYGARGGAGKISVSYIRSQQTIASLLLHMPNPDSAATFVPVINVGDGMFPPDINGGPGGIYQYEPVSPHPGVPVRYDGTYSTVLIGAGWDTRPGFGINVARTLKIRIQQWSKIWNAVRADKILTWENFVPAQSDEVLRNGLIPMGNVTLPLRWLPPDNQDTYYVFTVGSTVHIAGNDVITEDHFLDILLLDVTGQTIGLFDTEGGGFTTWFIDEPESGQSFGGILGSNYGRTSAQSATRAIVSVSGGPFMLEPGTENMLLAYTATKVSANVAETPDPPASVPAGAPAAGPATDTWVMGGGWAGYPPGPFEVFDPAEPGEPIQVTNTTAVPGEWQVTRGPAPVDHAPGFVLHRPPKYEEVWRPLALGADYCARWWFDRADDLLAGQQDPAALRARHRNLPRPASQLGARLCGCGC